MPKKGFTLIELLVVIAITGLLSSIILVNVRSSKDKARDASIQSSMHQVRNAAEMNYINSNESYTNICDEADDTLSNTGEFGYLEAAIKAENGNVDLTCFESVNKLSFAVSSPMIAATGKHWCIESAGLSQELDDAITTAFCE